MKMTGVPPVVGDVTPAITATPRTRRVTVAATSPRLRLLVPATVLAMRPHPVVLLARSAAIAPLSSELLPMMVLPELTSGFGSRVHVASGPYR